MAKGIYKNRERTERRISAATSILLCALTVLAQIAVTLLLTHLLKEKASFVYGVLQFIGAVVAIRVYLRTGSPSYKLSWMCLLLALPVSGMILFCVWGGTHQAKQLSLKPVPPIPQRESQRMLSDMNQAALSRRSPTWGRLSAYLQKREFWLYRDTAAAYFGDGEAFFRDLIEHLRQAETYIFMEYYILAEGTVWDEIFAVLKERAAHGVEIHIIVDDFGTLTRLSDEMLRAMREAGIEVEVFNPVHKYISRIYFNYRDHRKILVIDGRVGFTGGVNLADEYINQVEKYGRWKDAAIMLEGEAVRSLTALFLQMWCILKEPEFDAFLAEPIPVPENAGGTAAPYGDCPLDGERVGEMVYIDLLNRARRYIHIMTPYLILDGELETALKFAAERGVDVHLILPGIADKKFANSLAKTHYSSLLDSGVKISEWTPGFVHAKVFVVDDREAVVGTINLDYRSLYHHFEDAVWLTDAPCIRDIEADFQATLEQCRTVENDPRSIWQGRWLFRALGMLLKVLAPLL